MIDPARRRPEYLPEIWPTDQRFKCVVSCHLVRCEHNARVSDRGWPTSKITLVRDIMRLPADDPTVQQKVRIVWRNVLSALRDGWVSSTLARLPRILVLPF